MEGSKELIMEIQKSGYQVILITSSSMNLDSLPKFDDILIIESFYNKKLRKEILAKEKIFIRNIFRY